jgi:HJR/Mrr/RecB family endonuclease
MIDFILISVIALIVMLYAYYRYKEERQKEEKLLIPKLESYKEKFLEERENFIKRSQELKNKMEEIKKEIENLKNKYQEYPWTESQIKYLKTMKGSEFEYYLTTAFQMLGFITVDLPFYKDHNLDLIIKYEDGNKTEYIAVDFLDYTEIKKLNKKYIEDLLQGKEKYKYSKLLIITNGYLDDNIKKFLIEKDINFFEIDQIVKFIPSLNFFYRYEELKGSFHNYEILYKEAFDEVIRREHWLSEVEEQLIKVLEKKNESTYNRG